MTSRIMVLTATAAASLALATLPANAAMPVTGAASRMTDAAVVQVQGAAPATAPTTTAPAAATPDSTADQPKARTRAKKKTSSRQKEIDQSVESGTVPRRYMKNVPQQYQQYIPWSKQ